MDLFPLLNKNNLQGESKKKVWLVSSSPKLINWNFHFWYFFNILEFCLYLFESRMVPQKNPRHFFPVQIKSEEKHKCDNR